MDEGRNQGSAIVAVPVEASDCAGARDSLQTDRFGLAFPIAYPELAGVCSRHAAGFWDDGVFSMSLRFRIGAAGSSAILLAFIGATPSSAETIQPPPAAAEEVEADDTDLEDASEADGEEDDASSSGQAAPADGGATAADASPTTQLGASGGGGTGGNGRPVQEPVKGGNQ